MLDGAIDVGLDFHLQRFHRMHIGQLLVQAMGYKRFKQPAQRPGQAREAKAREHAEEGRVGQQAGQYGGDFVVGVGSDGIEFAHHVLVVQERGMAFWPGKGRAVDR
ncbi:hypothetical protein D3C78_1441760 [compost metagenome]